MLIVHRVKIGPDLKNVQVIFFLNKQIISLSLATVPQLSTLARKLRRLCVTSLEHTFLTYSFV